MSNSQDILVLETRAIAGSFIFGPGTNKVERLMCTVCQRAKQDQRLPHNIVDM